MGLDMYAYRRGACQSKKEMTQIAEWRKHNRLHGYMEDLWISKVHQDFSLVMILMIIILII